MEFISILATFARENTVLSVMMATGIIAGIDITSKKIKHKITGGKSK